ncbi:hypothetical protein MAQ5080_02597 [Marinomonas aquimarina]|uniref:Transcriptional regulator SutA RNAP-binding domain-containing protein n=1 Tax=Marinomonas aquimarina TaxID=295068 RepID=A0A1A8TJ80_9GAMM|nr:hypothetical protein [Marinomonas aquimarina]SBS33491.1 hypothetical protein MAQ5080_02597 [Marinomonas aquimarina]
MTKPTKTKAQTRKEIESQIESFIRQQGEIEQVEMGASGLQDGKYNTSHMGFIEPKKDRTPLNHVVAAIQQRKSDKKPPLPLAKPKQPKKKVIYDDFGDPIRYVWED